MKIVDFVEKLFRLSQVPITVYDKQGKLIFKIPLWENDYAEFEEKKRNDVLDILRSQNFSFQKYDQIIPIGICGCAGREYDFVLGPFAYGKLDRFDARRFMREKKLIPPVFCRLTDVLTAAEFTLEMYSDTPLNYDALSLAVAEQTRESVAEMLVSEEMAQYDSFQKNHDYREEEIAMERISSGDLSWIEEHKGALLPSYPIFLDDIIKNEEYIAVLAISLAARAAIQGGVTSQEGFLINDIYLKKLSKCISVEQIHQVTEDAVFHCVNSVIRTKKIRVVNIHVEACKNSMVSHKRDKINLDMIAKECGISKGYMQKLFREHEGISAKEYYMKVKMDAACNLLKHSDRSVGEIALYLGFGSLSYFSDIFKRKMGVAPAIYRSLNQSKEFITE